MKKTSKWTSLLLIAALITVLCGCGGNKKAEEPKASETKEAAVAVDEAEADAASAEEKTDAASAEKTDAGETAPAGGETEAAPAGEQTAEEPELPVSQDEEIAEQYAVADVPYEGAYSLFAVRNEGYTVRADEMGLSSSLTLEEGGTGTMTLDAEEMAISSWTVEDGKVTITMEDESSAGGDIRGGIIELDIMGTGTMYLIYAQEAADTSGYVLLTREELKEQMEAAEKEPDTRIGKILSSLNIEEGIHLHYTMRLDAMNSVIEYDVHGKGESYYSLRTTTVGDFKQVMAVAVKDGKVYNLYPEKMTGNYVTDLPLSVTQGNILLMDSLYSEMKSASQRSDFTEEEREAEGAAFSADVYPQTEYQPETVFFFDGDGNLVHCLKGAPLIEGASSIGESFYTVDAIDSEVDERLFDISAYTIEE